jgi:hypothetical protein
MQPPTVPENRLLQLFSADARAELGPLVTVRLAARQELLIPDAPTLHAYFPLTAVVSLISTMESGASAEVALVGPRLPSLQLECHPPYIAAHPPGSPASGRPPLRSNAHLAGGAHAGCQPP